MDNKKHVGPHDAAFEILKTAKADDSGFSYVLLTTHEDSDCTTQSRDATSDTLVQLMAHSEPELLLRAFMIAIHAAKE